MDTVCLSVTLDEDGPHTEAMRGGALTHGGASTAGRYTANARDECQQDLQYSSEALTFDDDDTNGQRGCYETVPKRPHSCDSNAPHALGNDFSAKMLTLNVSLLTKSRLTSILQYALENDIIVIALQETRHRDLNVIQ